MHHFLFHGKYTVAENPTHANTQLNILIPIMLNILQKQLLLCFIQLLSGYKIKHGLDLPRHKYYKILFTIHISPNIQFKKGQRRKC